MIFKLHQWEGLVSKHFTVKPTPVVFSAYDKYNLNWKRHAVVNGFRGAGGLLAPPQQGNRTLCTLWRFSDNDLYRLYKKKLLFKRSTVLCLYLNVSAAVCPSWGEKFKVHRPAFDHSMLISHWICTSSQQPFWFHCYSTWVQPVKRCVFTVMSSRWHKCENARASLPSQKMSIFYILYILNYLIKYLNYLHYKKSTTFLILAE